MAHESNLKDIFADKKIVRIFIFHLGNAEKTIISLKSVIEQKYPYKKIFIVIFNRTELSQLLTDNNISEVEFIDREFFADRLYNSADDYVQFVMPGDKLLENRITTMIELGSTDHCQDVSFSLVQPPIKSNNFPTFVELSIRLISFQGTIDLYRFFKDFLTTSNLLFGGITRAFFKQEYFTDDKFNRYSFNEWIKDDQMLARQLLLWESCSKLSVISFVPEMLIEADDECDSIQSKQAFFDTWTTLLEKYHGSELLSEDEYIRTKNLQSQIKLE